MGEGWVMDKLVRICESEELHYSAPEVRGTFWMPQAIRPQHLTPARNASSLNTPPRSWQGVNVITL